MPRVLASLLVGAGLAMAGAVMQALTRNPLAEPGILGVNAGASVAVVCAISGGLADSPGQYTWFALGGAACASLVVQRIGQRASAQHQDRTRLVLAGTALAACLGSVTGTITMFDSRAFDQHRFWVVGSVADRPMEAVTATAPFLLVGALLALALGNSLDALALGDEHAASLGVHLTRVRLLALLCLTLLAGASTALAGPIGFVGLMVPHFLRLAVGPTTRLILPLSVILGPALVLAADILGRLVVRPSELEAGIVTSLLGAPLLLWMVARR